MPGFVTLARALSVSAESVDTLPTEFRIFKRGVNEATKGPVTFDDASAASVLDFYRAEGVDVMIDLEHDSLSDACRIARADAGDAMGWCQIEVRDGALWAVNVRWNAEGSARLLAKKQRYISPAFVTEAVDGAERVTRLLNVALVAMPATYGAEPLVAASKLEPAGKGPAVHTRSKMDPKQVMAALDALESGDSAKALELLKALIASAASGGETPAAGGETPEALGECADPKPKPEDAQMLSRLVEHVGKFAARDAEITRLSKIVEGFEAERTAADNAARADLVGELVKLGVELPATAWSDSAKRVPAARFLSEPLPELRSRVEAYRAAGVVNTRNVEPTTITLSRGEEEQAAKMTPDQRKRYEDLRASRRAR